MVSTTAVSATNVSASVAGFASGTVGSVIGSSIAPPAVRGDFSNLKASATGTNATVTVTADELVVEDSSFTYQTLRSISLSINSAGSGANGLDTGSLAGSTWYSVWVIYNGTTTAGLLSTSATAPTMPSGYTYKARVGWIRTDGTANKYPLSFLQYGRKVQYKIASGSNVTGMPLIVSGAQGSLTAPTWIAASVSNFVPSTASVIRLALTCGNDSNAWAAMVAANNNYGAFGSATNPPPLTCVAQYEASRMGEITLESTNIYYAGQNAAHSLFCVGWEDNL